MRRPDLSIIIVSWNVCRQLECCLQSLPSAVSDAYSYEVIVVDNASTDGTVQRLMAEYDDVIMIANSENHLYTAAANQGLQQACGRHLLLLNPDTEPQAESFKLMVAYADRHDEVGLLGPRIIDGKGQDDLRSGRHFPTPSSEFLDWLGLTRRFPHSRWLAANRRPGYNRATPSPVPLLSGACLLISEYVPEHLKRLDSRYPMYAEDVDLCLRMQMEGYVNYLLADARIIHLGGESSRQMNNTAALLAVQGANRFFQYWYEQGTAISHRLAIATIAAFKWAVFRTGAFVYSDGNVCEECRLHARLFFWAIAGTVSEPSHLDSFESEAHGFAMPSWPAAAISFFRR